MNDSKLMLCLLATKRTGFYCWNKGIWLVLVMTILMLVNMQFGLPSAVVPFLPPALAFFASFSITSLIIGVISTLIIKCIKS